MRAHSIQGWGPFSDPASIKAATFPNQPIAPSTSINNIFVKIVWDLPYSNSATITGYKVYVAASNSTFILESTYCNGLIDPVLTAR